MDRCLLKGMTLLEVVVVLVVMGIILSVLIPNSLERIKKAKCEKTVHELTVIAEAAVDYFLVEGIWPSLSQLAPKYIPSAITSNPFGESYQILGMNKRVIAFTLIPVGIIHKDYEGGLFQATHQGNSNKIEVYRYLPHEFTSRLNYDLKYVY